MSSIASVAQRDMLAGDDNNAEQTCGAFSTALDAAKAHDTEALRVYGPAAEAMLNFPMANYPDVTLPLLHTSSLQLSRRRPARPFPAAPPPLLGDRPFNQSCPRGARGSQC
jgi:hypothetical protein